MSEPRAKLITCRIDPAHEVVPNPQQAYRPYMTHWCNDCSRETMSRSDWHQANIGARLYELGWEFGSAAGGQSVVLSPISWPEPFYWMASSRKMKLWAINCGKSDNYISEEQMIAKLLEIIGDPWRRPSGSVSILARAGVEAFTLAALIEEDSDYSQMPVLADCLEDAGFGYNDVLEHLRYGLHHLPGCWALDVVLGRA